MCAQNARFYLEATIIVHGEIILPIRCFSQFPQLFDLFFFSCLSVFTQVGPSVPEIFNSDFFRGDFLTEVRVCPFIPEAICAQNVRLHFYCGEVILPTCCFSPRHFSLVCFCLYIFLFNLSFFACLSVLLVFFFRCVPVRDAVRILCRISASSAAMS